MEAIEGPAGWRPLVGVKDRMDNREFEAGNYIKEALSQ